jgi:hypothetical protein
MHFLPRGRDSSVGIVTRYELDGMGIESIWKRDFPHPSRAALALTQTPVQWVWFLPGGTAGGRGVDHLPHLASMVEKMQGYTSTNPLGFRGLL